MNRVKINELVPGQVIYESEHGMDAELTVMSAPVHVDEPEQLRNGWTVQVSSRNGAQIELFDAMVPGYGLRLYTRPQYGNVI